MICQQICLNLSETFNGYHQAVWSNVFAFDEIFNWRFVMIYLCVTQL